MYIVRNGSFGAGGLPNLLYVVKYNLGAGVKTTIRLLVEVEIVW